MSTTIRTRFAPAPTGFMHLGNVRTVLMNYLFTRQKSGTFVLRIEDTDQQRIIDADAKQILTDLAWLDLDYDEGPIKGGPYAPYVQSQRTAIYQQKLDELKGTGHIYRCFCTVEELEKKRQRQVALKLPPRYDRTCLALSADAIEKKLADKIPFIWRMKLDHGMTVTITDLAHGKINFELKNFSDFPLTRQDGSFTFLFANFVDDLVMKMTHIFRGEDHLTNTANQAAMFHAFNAPLPIYWHMPILFNTEGKKLSKRDFGFSLKDLKEAGYLPEAICNYLAIIGGGTFEQEIMSKNELIKAVNFGHISSTGQVRYDVEKLTWLNHKWIDRLNADELMERCLPFLQASYPAVTTIDKAQLTKIIQIIKTDLNTLAEITNALHFYFNEPIATYETMIEHVNPTTATNVMAIIKKHQDLISSPEQFLTAIKAAAKEQNISIKELFTCLRIVLMDEAEGPSIHDLFTILGIQEATARIKKAVG